MRQPTWAQLGEPRASLLRGLAALAQRCQLRIYLVGGGVRDLLLDRLADDLDVLVEGEAWTVAQAAQAAWGGSLRRTPAFGTVTWQLPQPLPAALGGSATLSEACGWPQKLDFATARREVYDGLAALPQVSAASLLADVQRRDFSINALLLALPSLQLLDHCQGVADLEAKVLRVLHPRSFHDDPTRAFRAARFAARLGLQLAPDSWRCLQAARQAGAFAALSVARQGHELDLLLGETTVAAALQALATWQVPSLFSGLHAEAAAAFAARLPPLCALAAAAGLSQAACLWLSLACELPRAQRQQLAPQLRRGKRPQAHFVHGPQRLVQTQQQLLSTQEVSTWQRLWAKLDNVELAVLSVQLDSLADVAPTLLTQLQKWRQHGQWQRRAIDGHTLQALGYAPGPGFSTALQQALQVARHGGDRAAQLAAALAVLQATPPSQR